MSKWELVKLGDVCEGKSSNIAQKDLVGNEGLYPIYGASGLIKNVDFYKYEQEYIAVIKDGAGIGRTIMCEAKSSVIGTMQALIPNESIDYRYMFYAVSRMGLSKYYNGATIPHIYFKDYKDEKIPLPPVDIQKKITAALDTANALIEKRKEQIEKLDLLIKSQFIEMFGDPVTNPKGWEKKHLEEIANVGSSRRVFVEELVNEGVPFYRGTEIGAMGTGESITPSLFITSQHYDRLKAVTGVPVIGDLLMPSICPDGRIWRVNTIDPFYFKDGRVLWVHFTEKSFDNTYLLYALKERIIAEYMNIASGTTFAELKIFSLKRVSVLLPPLVFQTQFAEFVQKVEAQKALLQKSLADMEQNYQSLLQKCFKGEIF